MWAKLINSLLGLWLIFAPAVMNHVGTVAEVNERVLGPIVLALAFVSLHHCTRRWDRANLIFGAWLFLSPLVLRALGTYPTAAVANDMLVGLTVAALSPVVGKVKGGFGGGWSTLWATDPYGVSSTAPERPTTPSGSDA